MKNLLGLAVVAVVLINIGCGADGERNTVINVKKESLPTQTAPNSNTQPANVVGINSNSGPKTNLTMEKYNSLKEGMSYEEVVKILGAEGTKAPGSQEGKDKPITYKWEGEDYSTVFITFQNNKMNYKTNVGLK
jgi:hypothetical protein